MQIFNQICKKNSRNIFEEKYDPKIKTVTYLENIDKKNLTNFKKFLKSVQISCTYI